MDFRPAVTLITIISSLFVGFFPPASAQTDEQMRAIVLLSGVSSEEELEEQDVERFCRFISNPLEINLVSRSRMISSGLMSPYQIASLNDYRSRSGDVLSFAELASIEGFDREYVASLRNFISLKSNSIPGQPFKDTLILKQEVTASAAGRGKDLNYGIKHRIRIGEYAESSLTARTTYDDNSLLPPSTWSLNATLYGRRCLGKAIIGDFNARFGQGLVLWSGMTLSGYSGGTSFCRRANGINPSYSYSGAGSHRGVSADFQFGRFVLSSFASFPGLREWCENGKPPRICVMPGANIAWYGRDGRISITGVFESPVNVPDGARSPRLSKEAVSFDFRWNIKGSDFFGEAAREFTSEKTYSVIGAAVPLVEDLRLNAVFRNRPEDKGMAAGLEWHSAVLTADCMAKENGKQWKFLLKLPLQVGKTMVLSLRGTERIRSYEPYLKYRTGLRLDLDYSSAGISARYGEDEGNAWKWRARVEGLLCKTMAGLTYLEGGRKTGKISAFLRGTVFIIDNWDDRIYSYERDAPGNFNVPAYYGRGFSLSAVGASKFTFGHRRINVLKLYFRASTTHYTFMKSPKPSRTELKVQCSYSI